MWEWSRDVSFVVCQIFNKYNTLTNLVMLLYLEVILYIEYK